MIRSLARLPEVDFEIMEGYPDYYPERPGGLTGGRGLCAPLFHGRKLGPDLRQLRPAPISLPAGFAMTVSELKQAMLCRAHPEYLPTLLRALARNLWSLVTRRGDVANGAALIARLRFAMKALGVPLHLGLPARRLIVEKDRVVGLEAGGEGKTLAIRASRGVVLAAGGFAHSQAMREQYQQGPVDVRWSSAATDNVGETIRMGAEIGAGLDLMDDAWWGPSLMAPGELPTFALFERALPGAIMVRSDGHRFVNESASYVDVGHAMYENDREGARSVPALLVMDQRYRSRYFLGMIAPGFTPKKALRSGHLKRADSLRELALQIGVDADALEATVQRFNGFARKGRDEDFGRGDSAYDRFYADPACGPNPCLAPIQQPPFYAVNMYPGDIGTKGGLSTNESAQVLREDGSVIEGLYAVGNNSASVMGNTYPGPGCTIGPSMTFGYVAARHAAQGG
jgi:3-oxosteroid 1-dehydrogenase